MFNITRIVTVKGIFTDGQRQTDVRIGCVSLQRARMQMIASLNTSLWALVLD